VVVKHKSSTGKLIGRRTCRKKKNRQYDFKDPPENPEPILQGGNLTDEMMVAVAATCAELAYILRT